MNFGQVGLLQLNNQQQQAAINYLSNLNSIFGTSSSLTSSLLPTQQLQQQKMFMTMELSLCSLLGSAGIESFQMPQGFALGLDDEIIIADSNNHRCIVVNFRGRLLRQLGCSGKDDGQLYFPRKVSEIIYDNVFVLLRNF